MNAIVIAAAAAIALVPAPKEQVWRDGTCAYAEKDVRYVRDAALPPEGYRLDIAPGGVTVASADDAGAFYARKTLKQLVFIRSPILSEGPNAREPERNPAEQVS